MRIRHRSTGEETSPASVERPNFAQLRPRRSGTAVSFLYSLSGHALLVWMLGSLVHQVSARQALATRYPLRAIEISTAPISWRPAPTANAGDSSPAPAAAPPGAGASALAPAEAHPMEGGGAEAPEPAVEPHRKQFQLPPVIARKKERQILIQTDLPPDLKVKAKTVVPELLILRLPALPKPRPEPLVAARRPEEPAPQRETPAVMPKLNPRNREQALAEVEHAAAPVMPNPPLSLPVANTIPIRVLDGVAGTKLPAYTALVIPSPEPLNVISIPDVAVPQTRFVVLPPGNQGAPPVPPRTGGEGAGSGVGPGSQAGRPPGAGAGAAAGSKPGQPDTAKGSGNPAGGVEAGQGSGVRAERAEGGKGSGGTGEGMDTGKDGHGPVQPGGGSGRLGEGVAGGLGTNPPPPGATRIERPRDGKFNVVVLGSSSAYPEAARVLSGKPVYTVYIRAGARKEWVLQYCLPKAAEQPGSLRGSTVPLEPPYPFVIYHPILTLKNDPDYVMVHGFISAAGKFEHLTAIGEIDASSSARLIAALEHWEFRPASRDGEPSAVEILLIIPRDPA